MNLQSPIPRIICLTLEDCRDRQLLVANEFEKVGIRHYEFFPGYSAESESVRVAYEQGRVKRYPPCFRCGKLDCGDPNCNNVLIPPQVAVALGFQAIFRNLGNADTNIYAICEDDIVFAEYAGELLCSPRFLEVLDSISLDSNEPVMLRMTGPAFDPTVFLSPTMPSALEITRSIVMSNPFFIANRAFAELACRRLDTIDHTADVIIHEHLTSAASCWTLSHQLVADRSWCFGDVPSLIHPKTKHLEHLRSIGAGETDQYRREHQRTLLHCKKSQHREYCVIGSPRCGSHFVSAFLNRNGLQIKHEALGEAGICAWQYAVFADRHPYIADPAAQSSFFVSFERLLLYARNPREAIASLIVENQKAPLSYSFRRRHIQEHFGVSLDDYANPVEQAACSYAYWYKLALARQPEHILHVESLLEDCNTAFSGRTFNDHDVSAGERGSGKPYLGFVFPPTPLADDWLSHLSDSTRRDLETVSRQLGYELF